MALAYPPKRTFQQRLFHILLKFLKIILLLKHLQRLNSLRDCFKPTPNLTVPISLLEIRAAITAMKFNKSPSTDGIPCEFYVEFWDVIAPHFLNMFNHILERETLTSSQSQMAIRLIPKSSGPCGISNFRSISLLNCDYKVMASVLARRLRQTLSSNIAPHQKGEVPGRLIFYNLSHYRDVIQFADDRGCHDSSNSSIRGMSAAIVGVDFKKAYDLVNRETMYSVTGMSILNGSNVAGMICDIQSIRQGCPLLHAPTLSLLGFEFSHSIVETAGRVWNDAFGPLIGILGDNACRRFKLYQGVIYLKSKAFSRTVYIAQVTTMRKLEMLRSNLDWPRIWKETAALPSNIRETMFLFNHFFTFPLFPTRTICHRLDPAKDDTCANCHPHPETEDHMIFQCPGRLTVWSWLEGIMRQKGCKSSKKDLIRGHFGPIGNLRQTFTLLAAYVFTTWKARNNQRILRKGTFTRQSYVQFYVLRIAFWRYELRFVETAKCSHTTLYVVRNSSSIKWYEIEREPLIEAVKKYQCLYDTNSKSYKNITVKTNAKLEISHLFENCTVEDVTTQWTQLVDKFRRVRKVSNIEDPTGTPTKDSRHQLPQWDLYHTMSFLDEHIKQRA
ncbi:Uncharacterized protein APZ42_025848 [Daphnia magna]|uniref:MADF domain-containing protein n=1 Tax=Daphnia magna TaxID=35525 RepID=A0A164SPS9_9CRUS|nr:Uncharacterized protein APZ42_025848 [Daphnia magna]